MKYSEVLIAATILTLANGAVVVSQADSMAGSRRLIANIPGIANAQVLPGKIGASAGPVAASIDPTGTTTTDPEHGTVHHTWAELAAQRHSRHSAQPISGSKESTAAVSSNAAGVGATTEPAATGATIGSSSPSTAAGVNTSVSSGGSPASKRSSRDIVSKGPNGSNSPGSGLPSGHVPNNSVGAKDTKRSTNGGMSSISSSGDRSSDISRAGKREDISKRSHTKRLMAGMSTGTPSSTTAGSGGGDILSQFRQRIKDMQAKSPFASMMGLGSKSAGSSTGTTTSGAGATGLDSTGAGAGAGTGTGATGTGTGSLPAVGTNSSTATVAGMGTGAGATTGAATGAAPAIGTGAGATNVTVPGVVPGSSTNAATAAGVGTGAGTAGTGTATGGIVRSEGQLQEEVLGKRMTNEVRIQLHQAVKRAKKCKSKGMVRKQIVASS
jgi:hypothetical protein